MTRRYAMHLRRPRLRGRRTPVVTPQGSARRLAVVGILSAALVAAVWVGTTETVAGQQISDMILYGRVVADPAVLGAATETLSSVSLAFAATVTLGLLILALTRGGFGLASAVVVLLGGANLTAQLLKLVLERPNLLGDVAYATGNSFPSGHVTIVSSLGLACVLVVPRRVRTAVAVVAATLIAAVGVSTMIAGWHRLADVEGAIFISLAWASLVTAILVYAHGWMPRRTWGRGLGGPAMRVVGASGAVAILAGMIGILVVGLGPTPLAELSTTQALGPRTFIAALAIAAGTSLIGCAAYVWALRGVAFELPG
ncbi:MAG: phosphatase PAP2 family protein [Candidatus Limnocylindrales bacterium]|jgi:membrane-associated phospholipid phosphatase